MGVNVVLKRFAYISVNSLASMRNRLGQYEEGASALLGYFCDF